MQYFGPWHCFASVDISKYIPIDTRCNYLCFETNIGINICHCKLFHVYIATLWMHSKMSCSNDLPCIFEMARQIKMQLCVVGDAFFCCHLKYVYLCTPATAVICLACSSVQCFDINSLILPFEFLRHLRCINIDLISLLDA